MNKFVKYLASGIGIATLAALGICYFVWSMHSPHRLIWFAFVLILCVFIWRYLSEADYTVEEVEEEGEDKQAKTLYAQTKMRKMTKWEQVGVVARNLIGVVIIGALVWTIGYGISCLFEWQPDFWEMHLLYGAITVGAICLVIYVACAAWVFFSNAKSAFVRRAIKSVLMWIAVILCSLAVAGAIFYFLFPLAIEY